MPDSAEDLKGEIQQGSVAGYYEWKISLKYKMQTTAQDRGRGGQRRLPRTQHQCCKSKDATRQSPNQAKKKKVEKKSFEEERQALLVEVKKNNQQLIKSQMERTFAYRRHEVIDIKTCPSLGNQR